MERLRMCSMLSILIQTWLNAYSSLRITPSFNWEDFWILHWWNSGWKILWRPVLLHVFLHFIQWYNDDIREKQKTLSLWTPSLWIHLLCWEEMWCIFLPTHWTFHCFDRKSKFAGEGIKCTFPGSRITDTCLYITETVIFITALRLTLIKCFLEFKLFFHLKAHVTSWSVESHAARARIQRINKGWYEGNPNVTSWLYPAKG